MTELISTILRLRYVISYLCEKSSMQWWISDNHGSSSLYLYEDIFPKTGILAQYHAIRNSGMYFHDAHLSQNTFHLFRFKEELEQDLHSFVLQSTEIQKKFLPKDIDEAMSKLKSMSKKKLEKKEGPYLLKLENNELDLLTLQNFAEVYLMAFVNNIKSFPYFPNDE